MCVQIRYVKRLEDVVEGGRVKARRRQVVYDRDREGLPGLHLDGRTHRLTIVHARVLHAADAVERALGEGQGDGARGVNRWVLDGRARRVGGDRQRRKELRDEEHDVVVWPLPAALCDAGTIPVSSCVMECPLHMSL